MHEMIIDEINRANLPAVFGELYYLLGYRQDAATLNYGDQLSLPDNLLFIGTMNTADVPMTDVLEHHLQQHAPELNWLITLLARANELIADLDQSVGPSHFLLGDELTEERARQAWEFSVMPTLREHFYGQSDQTVALTFDQLRAYALTGDVDAAAD